MERRANKYEFEALKLLAHLVSDAVTNKGHLDTLAEAAGAPEAAGAFLSSAKALLGTLTGSMPLGQRKQLLRHVSDMKVTFSSPVAVSRDEAYSYVPRETILRLIRSAALDKCALCLCGEEEIRNCQFRAAVNELRMDNVPDDVLGCTVRLLAGGK